MPEHAALTIRYRRVFGRLQCFFDSKILMVSCKHFKRILPIHIKANEILQNIQETCFLEHSLKESIKRCILCILITAVNRLPCHKAILARCNRTRTRSCHITHYANRVIDKHRRNFIHVVTQLTISRRCIRFLAGRGFQLNNNQRQPIHKENNIRSFF